MHRHRQTRQITVPRSVAVVSALEEGSIDPCVSSLNLDYL